MKMSEKQKKVIVDMRSGISFYFNPITNYRPYTKGNYGMNASMIHGKIMNQLEDATLIYKSRFSSAIFKYHLTELGKTIQL